MNTSIRNPRKTWRLALAAGLSGLLLGGMATALPAAPDVGGCGHDARLDDADAHLIKAVALILASSNPSVDPPFGGHDAKALRALDRARKEIAQAIRYAETACD